MKKIISILISAACLVTVASCNPQTQNPDIEIADTTEPTASVLSWVDKATSVTDALPEMSKEEFDSETAPDEQPVQNPFHGDWIGVVSFSECTGQLAGNEGLVCDIVARFLSDQDGSVRAFLAIPVQADMNFKDVSASFSQDTQTMLLNASLFNIPSNGSAVVGLDDQNRASFSMTLQNDIGDQANIRAIMRQAGQNWTEEDTNVPSEETLTAFTNLGIYVVAEGFGVDTSLIPE